MPKNLPDNPASFPTATSPIAGEPRTAGSIEVPFQKAADRTAYLKDRVDFIDPTRDGARRLRRFATVTAMKAATDLTDGGVAVVDGGAIYQYSSSSTLTEALPIIAQPNTGGGRWIFLGYGALDVANGIPQLNGSGKLATSKLACGDVGDRIVAGTQRWSLADYQASFNSSSEQTASLSPVDLANPQHTIACLAGDVLEIETTFVGRYTDANGPMAVRMTVVKPDASVTDVDGTFQFETTNAVNQPPLTLVGSFTVTAAGVHTVKLRYNGIDTGTSQLKRIRLITRLLRP
jgi:hypothetical protein